MIRRSGENISAVEVESVLNQHPAVAASAVAPTPDPVRGDEVLACIVLRKARRAAGAGQRRDRASSATRWSGWPTSRRRATSPSSMRLPLTASQKIQRGELREMARNAAGQAAAASTRAS